MGSSTERQHSSSKNSGQRLHRGDQRVNTNLLRPEDATRPGTLQQLDLSHTTHCNSLSTCSSSNSRSFHVSTSRVLQRLRPDSVATQQSHLWTTQQSKSMAKPPSRGDATTWTTKETPTSYAMWTTFSSLDNRRRSTSCSRAFSSTFYFVQQESSQSATPSAFWAKTSATKVTTTRSASQIATQHSCWKKPVCSTVTQHQHQATTL